MLRLGLSLSFSELLLPPEQPGWGGRRLKGRGRRIDQWLWSWNRGFQPTVEGRVFGSLPKAPQIDEVIHFQGRLKEAVDFIIGSGKFSVELFDFCLACGGVRVSGFLRKTFAVRLGRTLQCHRCPLLGIPSLLGATRCGGLFPRCGALPLFR
jgi:hypothetical protein